MTVARERRPRLGLDTATPFLAVALWWPDRDEGVSEGWRLDRRLAAELVPRLDAFLRRQALTPADIGGVGVGVGPGSFTGARVGVAWALAVGRALGVPVVGGDTLAARALATVPPGGSGWAAVEARRGEAWLQPYDRSSGQAPLPAGPPRIVPLDALPADAAAGLGVPPDATLHARGVDAPGAAAPYVRYRPGTDG